MYQIIMKRSRTYQGLEYTYLVRDRYSGSNTMLSESLGGQIRRKLNIRGIPTQGYLHFLFWLYLFLISYTVF